MGLSGPRLILALAPCPTGWDYEPSGSVEIGKLAVATGVWPLKEYVDGKVTHTRIPHPRLPVREYLKGQGRFAHLFAPREKTEIVAEIQARVDRYWLEVA
jgi:pyruvate ferredoxin oxidoreductase beta subunit